MSCNGLLLFSYHLSIDRGRRIVKRLLNYHTAEPGTAHSALVLISGAAALRPLAESWMGTVQWTARSPFRPEHKRKNWFVGIDVIDPADETRFDPKEIRWQTK